MKLAIDTSTEMKIYLTAETPDDRKLLTTLWEERMVLGTALMSPGTRTVEVLSVELKCRDLRSDMQEIRR
ncbi:MAG TPA: hypothetical protein VKW06_10485 [Candidatus Angelobacter sp.]|nr:hypothetical protein [Candidatus Angelobacter sp.]